MRAYLSQAFRSGVLHYFVQFRRPHYRSCMSVSVRDVRSVLRLAVFPGLLISMIGCAVAHQAPISPPAMDPIASAVTHRTRLWVEFDQGMLDEQCVKPKGQRELCFQGVRRALEDAVGSVLWTSFPEIERRTSESRIEPTDYVLKLAVALEPLPPDARAPGWSVGARGAWELQRGSEKLARAGVASRSRGDLPYGSSLGTGAADVLSAIATQVAKVAAEVPERLGPRLPPLPAVAVSMR
jgi:hypothetical protein